MKKILLFLIFLISMCSFSVGQESKDFIFDSFITLKGISPEYNHTFFIQKSWDIKDAELKLKFSQTQIKHYKNSSMTIFVNEIPINSVELYPLRQNYELDLKIPKEALIQGFNNIRIKLFHRITDEECTLDEINTANWVVIDRELLLNVQYENKVGEISLLNYPFPFVTENGNLQTVIALPDNPDIDEVASALTISSFLGRKAKFFMIPIKIIKVSEIDGTENVILISKNNKLSGTEYQFTDDEVKGLNENKGIIKEVNTGDKKLLLIAGKTGEAIKNSTKVLIKENLYFQLKPDSNIIGDISDKDSKEAKQSTLKDFGYNDVTLKGRGQKIISYNLDLDKNMDYNNLKLKINFKTTDNIDFSKSEVTAYVNNVPVSSKRIVGMNSNSNSLEFFINPKLLSNGTINLKLEFYIMTAEINCNDLMDDSTWILVENNSELKIAGTKKIDYNLGVYPAPFIENYQLRNTGFVVPENLSLEDLTYLLNTSFYLGKNTLNSDYIEVYNDLIGDKNLIVYGTLKEKYIQNINNKLILKYNKEFTAFENTKEISFLEDNNTNFGALQIIKDNKRYIMVVSGTSKTETAMALSYLTKSSSALKGDVLLISQYGQTTNLGDDINNTAVSGIKTNAKLIAVAVSFILAILMGGITFFMYKKGEKK